MQDQFGSELMCPSTGGSTRGTFAHTFPASETLCGDIRDLRVRVQVTAAGRGVDVLVGGPPCQPFFQVRHHARIT